MAACKDFCDGDATNAVRQRALLALAVVFLQHFVRANWTGPPEQAELDFDVGKRGCPAKWAEKQNDSFRSGSDEFGAF